MGTIKSRQAAMDFQSAGQRSGCRDCKHGKQVIVDRMPPYDTAGWECKLGGFKVSAMAICSKHESKRQIGGAA